MKEDHEGWSDRSHLSDRRHPSIAAIVALITLMIQLAALVWGAASLNAAVQNLARTATQIQVNMITVQQDIGTLKVDVGILKAQRTSK